MGSTMGETQEKSTEGGGCTYTVLLSGHALCVISAVCPVFVIAFFFSVPCAWNLFCASGSKCQQLDRPECMHVV